MRAVIYARVSSDPKQQERSVDKQEELGRQECSVHQWSVERVFRENDRSASRYAKRDRPVYAQLVRYLEQGKADVLVCWESSRTNRDLDAYLKLRDICADTGTKYHYSGRTYDLTRTDDRFQTGLDALLAERESATTRDRVLKDMARNAAMGRPHGKLLYGYRREYEALSNGQRIFLRQVPDEKTSKVVIEAAKRTAAGESCYAIAKDFTARKIPVPRPPTSGPNAPLGVWDLSQVKSMVTNPGYIGRRIHRGKDIGKAVWEPLLSEEVFYSCVRRLSDPSRRTTHDLAVKHLLTGILTCAECGAKIRTMKQRGGYRSYMCGKNFCVARKCEYVEKFVEELVTERLSRKDALELLIPQNQRNLTPVIEEKKQLLKEYIDLAKMNKISPTSFADLEKTFLAEISSLEEQEKQQSLGPVLADVVGSDAAEKWEKLNIMRKREIIRSLFSTLELRRMKDHGRRGFDPRCIRWQWKKINQNPAEVDDPSQERSDEEAGEEALHQEEGG